MEYYCTKIDKDIILDGNIDKAEWQVAREVKLVDTVTGCSPILSTQVKLLWNDKFLYIGFLCIDDYINATMTQYNDKLYEEEVVEVFIDAACDKKSYIEVEVNPLNALLHYFIYGNNEDSRLAFGRIESTIKTAVLRNYDKEFWSVEIAIPFTEFITTKSIPPQKGDKWLMNLYRIDRPKNGRDKYDAWSPTWAVNFHCPESFGNLVFD